MKELFSSYNINLTDEQVIKLEKFAALLKEYGSKFNITAVLDDEGIKIKHFLDSCLFVDKLSTECKVIEIGSGGGFPSVPIKILRPDLEFTLVEATGKKCEFLKTAIKELSLEKVNVVNARAEDLAHDKSYREKFDYSTARAVARLNVLSELCIPFLKVGGKFIAFKGEAKEELGEASSTFEKLSSKVDKVYEFELPCGAGKRNIIEIEKLKSTAEIYPRSYSKIKKSPL